MEENLIKFTTAKLAKEKGLTYDEVGQSYRSNGDFTYGRNDQEFYPAPTQSILQKWLREEYDIIVLIDYSYWDDCFKFNIGGKSVNPDKLKGIDFSIEFGLYEDALEEGLIQALQLIPTL